jgi:hypothetical protein
VEEEEGGMAEEDITKEAEEGTTKVEGGNEDEVSSTCGLRRKRELTVFSRVTEDEYQDNNSFRRRNNERGEFSSPRRDAHGGGGGGSYGQAQSLSGAQSRFKDSVWKVGSAEVRVQLLLARPELILSILLRTSARQSTYPRWRSRFSPSTFATRPSSSSPSE